MSGWSDSFNFRRSVSLLMKLPELRGILQYVTRFRDKVFVIAINGEILESENFPNILLDIAVLRSLNIKVVLVHGAAFQIEKAAAQRGTSISNNDGTGVIDAATLPGCSLDLAAARAVARACLWRSVPATDEGSARAQAEALVRLAVPCAMSDVDVHGFHSHPERTLVDASSSAFDR